jgi:hypothetical protein
MNVLETVFSGIAGSARFNLGWRSGSHAGSN